MVKYICEVNKDSSNNELSLVNKSEYGVKDNDPDITFSDSEELNKYLDNHCISESKLKKTNNSFNMFLFILIVVILGYSLFMLFRNNNVPTGTPAAAAAPVAAPVATPTMVFGSPSSGLNRFSF